MINFLKILFCFLLSYSIGNAQSIKRNVISSFGASASISNTILESSFGQPSNIGTVTDSNNFIRQGFQQPLYQPQTPCSIAVLDTQNITCYGGNDGYIQVQGTGGSGLFHYSLQIYDPTFGFWYQIAQSPLTGFTYAPVTFPTLYADCYKIIMTDNLFCVDTVDVCLSQPAEIITNNTVSSCDSYDWDGVTYSSSGIYTNLYTNVNGCDSTVNLDLTITSCPGCTDSLANNYNPFATVDDSTCLYSPFVFGCTDSTALNYDPLATVDDSSCCYSSSQFFTQIGQDIDGEGALDHSGWSVSNNDNGNIVAIGAYGNDDNGNNSGHVRVFDFDGVSWNQIGQDIDGENSYDKSGYSISLNSTGNILAISSPFYDGNLSNSGQVRVFENLGGNWIQIGQDLFGEFSNDNCASSVSLNNTGNIIAIGAKENDGNGSNSGHVRIYEFDGSQWIQMGQDIDGEYPNDNSGYSVSLSSDGMTVAIGAPDNDGNGANSGHVRVFEYFGSNWIQKGQDINGEYSEDHSGHSVSFNSNGNILAIGSPRNDDNGQLSGHVRVFEYISSNWIQLGNNIIGDFPYDEMGGRDKSISLNNNGNIIVIGVGEGNSINGSSSGYTKVFKWNGNNWLQLFNTINGNNSSDHFGKSVKISGNSMKIVVGADENNSNGIDAGQVKIYDITTPCSDLGCLDPLALNFDPYATVDDSSCVYPIYGCIDSLATNFNSFANISDSSCTYLLCKCRYNTRYYLCL